MMWLLLAADIDTPAGTVITSNVTVNYQDEFGNSRPEVKDEANVTVATIYGVAWNITASDNETGPGVAIYYPFKISNEGNAPDTYSLSYTVSYTGASGSPWTIEFVKDDNQDGIHDPTETTTITSITAGEDEDVWFFLKVTPSTDALFNSTANVTITVTSSGSDGDAYTGDNGLVYGGPDSITYSVITRVAAPVIEVALSQQITLGGSSSSPVPGATVNTTATYDNDGNRNATNVQIVLNVDPNTQFVSGSASYQANTGATVTVEYYDGTSWTTTEPADPSQVQAVRFTINNVGADNSSTDTSDTFGSADGTVPDVDAGSVSIAAVIK